MVPRLAVRLRWRRPRRRCLPVASVASPSSGGAALLVITSSWWMQRPLGRVAAGGQTRSPARSSRRSASTRGTSRPDADSHLRRPRTFIISAFAGEHRRDEIVSDLDRRETVDVRLRPVRGRRAGRIEELSGTREPALRVACDIAQRPCRLGVRHVRARLRTSIGGSDPRSRCTLRRPC